MRKRLFTRNKQSDTIDELDTTEIFWKNSSWKKSRWKYLRKHTWKHLEIPNLWETPIHTSETPGKNGCTTFPRAKFFFGLCKALFFCFSGFNCLPLRLSWWQNISVISAKNRFKMLLNWKTTKETIIACQWLWNTMTVKVCETLWFLLIAYIHLTVSYILQGIRLLLLWKEISKIRLFVPYVARAGIHVRLCGNISASTMAIVNHLKVKLKIYWQLLICMLCLVSLYGEVITETN